MAKKKEVPSLQHLDYVLVKPWPGCRFGLARIYKKEFRGKIQINAEGHCFDENGKPFSFTVDLNRECRAGYNEYKKVATVNG